MKIEINVGEESVGKSIQEVFAALTQEERKDLARQVMLQHLNTPQDAERTIFENQKAKEFVDPKSYDMKTEADVRQSYKFREACRTFVSSKEVMVKEVSAAAIAHYKEVVRELVRNDPKVLAMKDEVIQIVRSTLPAVLHDCMVAMFGQAISAQLNSMWDVKSRLDQLALKETSVQERLAQVAQRVGLQ